MIPLLAGVSLFCSSCRTGGRMTGAGNIGGKQVVTDHRSRVKKRPALSGPASAEPKKQTSRPETKRFDYDRKPGMQKPDDEDAGDDVFNEGLVEAVPVMPVNNNRITAGKANMDDPLEKGPIVIEEDQLNQIVLANGRDVVLDGDDRVIVISGGCGSLKLTGDRNQVQCDAAQDVEIIGDDNMLVFGEMGTGAIRGTGNEVTWGAGLKGLNPMVTTAGGENAIKRLE